MTTDELRRETRRRLGACSSCGRGIKAERADEVGLPYHTLQRFLRGQDVAPEAVGKIATWLEAQLRLDR